MKFIAFSDIHFSLNKANSYTTETGISSWTKMQFDVLDDMFSFARDKDVETIIHNGDFFDDKNRINVSLYNLVWSYFKDKSKEFNIITNTGNHDLYSVKKEGSLKPFSDILTVVDEPFIFGDAYYSIKLLPFNMIENNLSIVKDKYNILFLHENIDVLTMSALDIKVETPIKYQIFKEWDLVLCGHIHKPQTYKNIINIGSTCINNYGEEGEQKRFIYFNEGNIESIETKCPQFYTLNALSPRIISKIEEDSYNFYRVDINSTEVSNSIFDKYNVSYRITKSEDRKIRLKSSITPEEEINEYVDIKNEGMDKAKLLLTGEKILKRRGFDA